MTRRQYRDRRAEVPDWPLIINLRADPYEKAPHESGMYLRWYADNMWLFVPMQEKLKTFLRRSRSIRSRRAAASRPAESTTTR